MEEVESSSTPENEPILLKQLEPVISVLESSRGINFDPPGTTILEGDFDGMGFRVQFPHLRKGKHATVGIVDINYPNGEILSVVLRRNGYDAREHEKIVKTHPFVNKYLPRQFGIVGDWAALERLRGLELEELTDRLKMDPDFMSQYASNTYQLISESAEKGLWVQDVMFVDGHNVIVNSDDASIRLVEQNSLSPYPHNYTSMEVITRELLLQVEKRYKGEPYQFDFSMALMQDAFKKSDPKDFYLRGRVFDQTHPNFMDVWDLYYRGQPYSPNGESEKLPLHKLPKIGDPHPNHGPIGYIESDDSRAFSDEFIQAVIENDIDKFSELIKSKKFAVTISDPADPRSELVVLKGEGL